MNNRLIAYNRVKSFGLKSSREQFRAFNYLSLSCLDVYIIYITRASGSVYNFHSNWIELLHVTAGAAVSFELSFVILVLLPA